MKKYEILLKKQNLQFVHKKPCFPIATLKNICYNECVNLINAQKIANSQGNEVFGE